MKNKQALARVCRSGFSLLEILVVLAVVSVLSAISLSAVTGIRGMLADRESWIRFTELTQAVRLYELERGAWPDWLNAGEVSLAETRPGWLDSIAPYYEGPFIEGRLKDGYGNNRIYLIVSTQGDGWIRAEDFKALPLEQRPERVYARIVAYSLDDEGRLAAATWK